MLNLELLRLDSGAHKDRRNGLCIMEATAWLAGEDHTDHPACVCPVLAAFGRTWNDALDDDQRQRLKPFIPRLLGTAGDGHAEARAWLATDWLVRVHAPAWLRLIARHDLADALERCAPVLTAEAARAARPALVSAQKEAAAAWHAVWDAARHAAWAAARHAARDAARDAARAAARHAAWAATRDAARAAARHAAWAATRDAARAATRDAARAAARDAAWAAAWDAARAAARDAAWAAAWDAARDAARERLRPTAEQLRESAFELYDRMIVLGEDSRASTKSES